MHGRTLVGGRSPGGISPPLANASPRRTGRQQAWRRSRLGCGVESGTRGSREALGGCWRSPPAAPIGLLLFFRPRVRPGDLAGLRQPPGALQPRKIPSSTMEIPMQVNPVACTKLPSCGGELACPATAALLHKVPPPSTAVPVLFQHSLRRRHITRHFC